MATFEDSGTLKYKDKAGNLHIMKPRTTSDNVEGLAQLLAEKENSGAAATALENAKAYTDQKIEGIPTPDVSAQIKAHNESQDAHPYIRGLIPTKTSQIENDSGYLTQHQDISGKLDKPANDATATAGQLLTKTANGQEWQDREKDVFVVNMTTNGSNISSVDKTFDEVCAAYNTGKTVIADIYLSQNDVHYILPSVLLKIDQGIMFAAVKEKNSIAILMRPTDIVIRDISIQDQIIAEGILKGNGNGGISSATAGTDYVAPNGDASNVTAAFTAASTRANVVTGEKLSVLFGKIAKWFADLGSLAFKSTVAKSDLASDVQTSLNKANSALQSAPVTSVNGKTGAVTISVPTVPSATSLIKGNGSGGLVAATRGSDYIASGNIVKQTLVATETTPTENYAINWVYG